MKRMISSNPKVFIALILPIGSLVLLGILWGSVPSIAKYLLKSGITPFNYLFWTLSIATATLVIINFIRGAGQLPRHTLFYFLCGLSGTAVPTAIMYFALRHIPAGLMVLIIALTPILVYLIGAICKIEKIHPLKTLGVLLGFIGIVLIMIPDSTEDYSAPLTYILLAICTPTLYAVNTIFIARYRPDGLSIFHLTSGMLIFSAIFVLFIAILTEPIFPIWEADIIIGLLILYHGLVKAAAFCIFYTLIKYAGPLFASQATYFVTLFGIGYGAWIHNEILPALIWLAVGMIFAGLGFIQRTRKLTDYQ